MNLIEINGYYINTDIIDVIRPHHFNDTRGKIYEFLLTGADGDTQKFIGLCKENNIKYLLDDVEYNGYTYSDGIYYNRQFFADNFLMVYEHPYRDVKVYKIY